jgi:protein-disulfide isomerase
LKASLKALGFSLLTVAGLTACAPSAPQLKKVMEDNPDILYSVIQKDPKKFLDIVNEAAQKARSQEEQKFVEEEKNRREEEFKNPKKPDIDEKRPAVGPKGAPVTIVEYSDFQCPYCKKGHATMEEVAKMYGDKVRIYFKDLPIERLHPMAMISAKYYEAVALQDGAKATKFKSTVFENQDKLNAEGEKFLEATAKAVGANVAKVKKDLDSPEVKKQIETDQAEANKFGFSGTPGYLVNGVSVKGAYPIEEFKAIIDRQLAKK